MTLPAAVVARGHDVFVAGGARPGSKFRLMGPYEIDAIRVAARFLAIIGGPGQNRTGIGGFAVRSMTTLPPDPRLPAAVYRLDDGAGSSVNAAGGVNEAAAWFTGTLRVARHPCIRHAVLKE